MKDLSTPAILILFFCLASSCQATNDASLGKIDINTASLEDLVKIVHIGEARAKELISLRPFSSLDELTRIKGLGELRLKDIKEQGLASIGSQPQPVPETEPSPLIIEDNSQAASIQITYPSGIVINEILPSPEGADDQNEWIEVFNQNSLEANLSNWQITDAVGAAKTYTLPEGTIISAKGYLVFFRPTTKITLNNSGDDLKLLRPDGNAIDEITYEKAPQGESFNRFAEGWQWSSVLTPGEPNAIPAPLPDPRGNIEQSLSGEEIKKEEKLAALSQQIPRTNSFSFFIWLTALAISLFCGIIILALKRHVGTFSR
ncbi:MAG: lamin tail domain-containing protein [bacterium]